MILLIALIVIAYLIGSIPTSVWIGKIFYKIDIRDFGSGNAGTTNTFRILGPKAGIPVFIFDTFKGFIAVKLVSFIHSYPDINDYVTISILLGIASIAGHIFPVFCQFRGGKGVATTLGVVISLHPSSALILFIIFLISLLISRFVSLSSIISAISFPLLLIFYFKNSPDVLIIFSLIISVLVIFSHKKNVKRLLAREEKKINLLKINKKVDNTFSKES